MDINYFLLLRGKYNQMLENIETILNLTHDIDDFTNEYVTDRNLSIVFNTDANKKIFVEKKKEIKYLINLCQQYIQSMCNHEFVKDDIDIDPDRSKTISYCQFCEHNDAGFK
jgi:hypothetical protein